MFQRVGISCDGGLVKDKSFSFRYDVNICYNCLYEGKHFHSLWLQVTSKFVWCHYKEADDELINSYDNELYILYEESGIIIDEEDVKGIGKKYKMKLLLFYSHGGGINNDVT